MRLGTKQEVSDTINEVLGTKIDFTTLKKEELEQLSKVLTSGELLPILLKGLRKHARSEIMDKPLGELLNRSEEKGGLLGFGILPIKSSIFNREKTRGGTATERS